MKSAGLKTGAGRSLLGALMGFGFCSQKDPKIPKSTNGGDGISSGAEISKKLINQTCNLVFFKRHT